LRIVYRLLLSAFVFI